MDENTDLLIGFDGFWKARLVEEAGKRWVYCEASNESKDQENQRIAKSALMESAPFFVANGNIDIDHMTILGHKLGKANPHAWEIGRPAEVKEGSYGVFVKGAIYKGGPKFPEFGGASAADYWWGTQKDQVPPMKWYPSVGGKPLPGGIKKVCNEGKCHEVITKCLWRNLAFAKEPQNLSVPAVSVVPFGEFAKGVILAETKPCNNSPSCSCYVAKTVVAGYGTDSAALSGGGALRLQSIQGNVIKPWHEISQRLSKALADGVCDHLQGRVTLASLTDHFEQCEGLDRATARRYAARFATQLRSSREAA